MAYRSSALRIATLTLRNPLPTGVVIGPSATAPLRLDIALFVADMSLGALVGFSVYLAELTWPVSAVGWVVGMFERGAGAASRINEVFDVQPGIESGPEDGQPAPRIRFERVCFRYRDAAEDALHDISFELRPKETLGIVGLTGAADSA